jgi:hypothetical protein
MTTEPEPFADRSVPIASSRPAGSVWRALATVLTLAIVAVAAWLFVLDPERHPDGRGRLSSLRGDNTIGLVAPTVDGDRLTFGLELCLMSGGDSAVIESIGPTQTVGAGAQFVGARLRTLDFRSGPPFPDSIGGVRDFPPPSIPPGDLVEAIGASVTHVCERENPKAYTELLLGLQAISNEAGGWHGVDVGYRSGWRHRVVSIQYNLLLCPVDDLDCDERLIG